jgi:beta-galactosidase
MAAWPVAGLADAVLERAARDAGLDPVVLPDGVRLRRHGAHRFAFNFAPDLRTLPDAIGGTVVLGERTMAPAGVCVLRD